MITEPKTAVKWNRVQLFRSSFMSMSTLAQYRTDTDTAVGISASLQSTFCVNICACIMKCMCCRCIHQHVPHMYVCASALAHWLNDLQDFFSHWNCLFTQARSFKMIIKAEMCFFLLWLCDWANVCGLCVCVCWAYWDVIVLSTNKSRIGLPVLCCCCFKIKSTVKFQSFIWVEFY